MQSTQDDTEIWKKTNTKTMNKPNNKSNNKSEPFLANPLPEKYIVLICIYIILGISILNLGGWAFGISILKSIDGHWVPMMIDTAISFILCAMSLYIIQKKITTGLLSLIPKISGVMVFIVGAITTCLQIAILNPANEKLMMENPFLGIFLVSNNRMALITACNFILIGIVLFLISFHKKKLTGIAHALIFPSLLISYVVPVSYILGVTNLQGITIVSVALPTAIAFCLLCVGILFNDTNSWVMKVFTSLSSGGQMARRLLPGMIVLPVVIGWLRIMGEKKGFFESGVGVVLVVITYTVCFVFLTWLSAKEANKIDNKRKQAEDSQRETNEYLENLFSYANAPIIVWDTKYRITRFNPAFELLTGRKAEEVIGYSIEVLFPVDLVKSSMRLIHKAQQGERLEIEEINIVHVDGTIKTVLWNSAPMFSTDGQTITEVIAQGQEITDRKKAEDSLRETNDYLENLFSYANAPIIVWDTKSMITRFNPAFELLTGRKAEEVIGHSIEILFPIDLVESSMALIQKAQNGARLEIEEINIVHVDGSIKTVLWNSAPMFSVDGQTIIEVIAQGQDITERKMAEDAMYESEDRFRTMANAIPQLSWIAHADGFIFWYNQRWYEYTGTTPEQMEGWGWQRVHDPVVLPSVLEKWTYSIGTGESFDMEFPLLGADGKFRTFLTRVMPMKDSAGRIIQWFGTNTDITELKQAETALKLLSSELEIIIDSIPGLVFYKDVNNHYLRVNKYMCDAYGKSKKQMEGIHLNELHTNEQSQAYYDADLRVIKSRTSELNIDEPWETEIGLRWVNTSKVPYMDQNGEVVGVIGVSMDVTERKLAERELEVYRKHLEELVTERTADLAVANHNLERSNKELEEFAYVASHDLQEPLRMVSSYTQLLERRYKDKLDQDANDFIQYAVDGASRMQKLINDLLDYSRVSSQGREFSKVDISQVLGNAVSNLQNLISDNLALVTNEDLPVINIDESQIIRVFQNLIENGIKYKKKTELPKIHIACKKKNNLYEFSVRDNGIGIDMQYHDRIFIIFQRLHKKDEFPGTGIGLSVTKRIIERHGGTIWFDSKKEVGTTFYFTIPA